MQAEFGPKICQNVPMVYMNIQGCVSVVFCCVMLHGILKLQAMLQIR